MMRCGICEEIKRRKAAGFPKKMIKSVANWWWVNVHDSECTSGNTLSDWVQDMETVTMDNQYDEGQVLENRYQSSTGLVPVKMRYRTLKEKLQAGDKSEKKSKKSENADQPEQNQDEQIQDEPTSEPTAEPTTEPTEPKHTKNHKSDEGEQDTRETSTESPKPSEEKSNSDRHNNHKHHKNHKNKHNKHKAKLHHETKPKKK